MMTFASAMTIRRFCPPTDFANYPAGFNVFVELETEHVVLQMYLKLTDM